jgi:hypothetical protein
MKMTKWHRTMHPSKRKAKGDKMTNRISCLWKRKFNSLEAYSIACQQSRRDYLMHDFLPLQFSSWKSARRLEHIVSSLLTSHLASPTAELSILHL